MLTHMHAVTYALHRYVHLTCMHTWTQNGHTKTHLQLSPYCDVSALCWIGINDIVVPPTEELIQEVHTQSPSCVEVVVMVDGAKPETEWDNGIRVTMYCTYQAMQSTVIPLWLYSQWLCTVQHHTLLCYPKYMTLYSFIVPKFSLSKEVHNMYN